MSLLTLPERLLQRAAHALMAQPQREWQCTNTDVIQIVAAGLANVHAGPDFQDVAVLHRGVVYIGDAEFHKRSSEWYQHHHSNDDRYEQVLLHVVLVDDEPVTAARWTLVLPHADLAQTMQSMRGDRPGTRVDVEELQHFALLRLLRLTADAQVTIRRLGVAESLRVLTASWLGRLSEKRHRPFPPKLADALRTMIAGSALGTLALELPSIPSASIPEAMNTAEQQRIAAEGLVIRRELLVNVLLPVLCARATHDQRVVLLQWYWSCRSLHPYGILARRFPAQQQDYIWQQQAMLEYLRLHGRRVSTCGEALRAYGVSGALEFIRASP